MLSFQIMPPSLRSPLPPPLLAHILSRFMYSITQISTTRFRALPLLLTTLMDLSYLTSMALLSVMPPAPSLITVPNMLLLESGHLIPPLRQYPITPPPLFAMIYTQISLRLLTRRSIVLQLLPLIMPYSMAFFVISLISLSTCGEKINQILLSPPNRT